MTPDWTLKAIFPYTLTDLLWPDENQSLMFCPNTVLSLCFPDISVSILILTPK